MNALSHGATEGQLRQDLATSTAAAGCINDLYNGILGRNADSAGLAGSRNALGVGADLT